MRVSVIVAVLNAFVIAEGSCNHMSIISSEHMCNIMDGLVGGHRLSEHHMRNGISCRRDSKSSITSSSRAAVVLLIIVLFLVWGRRRYNFQIQCEAKAKLKAKRSKRKHLTGSNYKNCLFWQ